MIKSRPNGMLLSFLVFLSACTGARPDNLGSPSGELLACPEKPNCVVSSASADAEHKIDPLPVYESASTSIATLEGIIKELPRTHVVARKDNYIWVEFESLIMRFVDDVEFYIPEGQNEVLVRSASRLGHSDLGANRKRIENIRQLYLAKISPSK